MPLLRKSDPLPDRPVIITIYGEPGASKTSTANTADNPLLLDFDRGTSRALFRPDTVIVNRWEDILEEERNKTFANYRTVIIDTPKGALDDYLLTYVRQIDVKNIRNKMAAYGAIGDEFKLFIANRRQENADIINICHERITEDGDFKRREPDVTGQSLGLIMRISDQVGYLSIQNKRRVLTWNPTEVTRGKNVAGLPDMIIPDAKDPAITHFMAEVIAEVRKAIHRNTEAQEKEIADMQMWKDTIEGEDGAVNLTRMVKDASNIEKVGFQTAVKKMILARTEALGLVWNKEGFFEPKDTAKADPSPKPE